MGGTLIGLGSTKLMARVPRSSLNEQEACLLPSGSQESWLKILSLS